ncbi:hypothetical protein COR50_20405 [Chitinophaga caeni]|uniref:DUF4019 domain-containing protein n=1 Tax=Chitinophaga caeni TaxID=2029983 RepID=A0A291QZH5_9BACT|nr:hypothetical protein [Chitinophaga caeni]ATL49348.1 hypothetical protein COR50_20405 [Chitinophaga caeni]
MKKLLGLLFLFMCSAQLAFGQLEEMQAKATNAGKFVYLLEANKWRKACRLMNADTVAARVELKTRLKTAAHEMKIMKKRDANLFFNVMPPSELDGTIEISCQYQDPKDTSIVWYEVTMLFEPGKMGKIIRVNFDPKLR